MCSNYLVLNQGGSVHIQDLVSWDSITAKVGPLLALLPKALDDAGIYHFGMYNGTIYFQFSWCTTMSPANELAHNIILEPRKPSTPWHVQQQRAKNTPKSKCKP
ncbi:hypothetical protein COP2_020734 [Malus domestica]